MKPAKSFDKQFAEVVRMIHSARYNAIKNVNTELVKLYWNIGEYIDFRKSNGNPLSVGWWYSIAFAWLNISRKLASSEWGDAVVDGLAEYIQENHPEFKGFTRRGLYRMRQFYETYYHNKFVSTVLTQISWSSHLHILSKTKTIEEKEFYLRLAIKERYSVRELERQIDSGLFERVILSKKKVSSLMTQIHPKAPDVFKDTYILDFLNLPEVHSESDLQKSIVANLKDFILEFGKDFAFVGQEYRIQVGNHDYFIDLLFFHRGLHCLVMLELKIDEFKPEYLGKLNFYLETLDRDVRKPDENPSVGIILCKSKDD